MNDFDELGTKHGTDKVTHHGYQFFYPRYLEHLRDQKFRMLEIGYGSGASARMWEEYFPKAEVFAMDISASGTYGRHEVIQGDQGDFADLRKVAETVGAARLVLDDGSHHPFHQFETFNFFFRNLVEPGGVYIIEDVECNYWNPEASIYGYRIGFFNAVDASTKLIDMINSEFSGKLNSLEISSITYGRNCIIITKQTEEEKKYFDRDYRFSNVVNPPLPNATPSTVDIQDSGSESTRAPAAERDPLN